MLPTPARGEEDSHQTQIMLVSIASFPYIRLFGKPNASHGQIIKWSLCSCSVPLLGLPVLWYTVVSDDPREQFWVVG